MTRKEQYYKYHNRELRANRKYHQTIGGRYSKLKTNAKQRGIIVKISLNEYKEVVKFPCYLCGGESLELSFGHGIDRVDNSVGYLLENVKACCGICNKMKMDSSLEDFIQRIKRIVKNYGNSS